LESWKEKTWRRENFPGEWGDQKDRHRDGKKKKDEKRWTVNNNERKKKKKGSN